MISFNCKLVRFHSKLGELGNVDYKFIWFDQLKRDAEKKKPIFTPNETWRWTETATAFIFKSLS